MASQLIPDYTGVLDDVHIVVIGQIFDIPVSAEGAYIYGPSHGPGAVETRSYVTQRTVLFNAIKAMQTNPNVESRVLALVKEWNQLPASGYIKDPDTGHEMGVGNAKRSIFRRLFAVYPIHDTRVGRDVISGR